MKQLKQIEEKFLNEIKPLVNQFIEMRKQETNIESKMECVDIRKQVQSKTDEFKTTYKEMLTKEIERIQAENIQINIERANKIRNMMQIKEGIISRDVAIKETKREGKDEDTYKLLCITQKDEIEKFSKMKQEYEKEQELYKSNIEQIEELKKAQQEFEEKYGDLDYITEKEMYRLDALIGENEERKTIRMSDSQAYDENGNVLSTDKVMDMQEQVDKERKSEFEEIQKQIAKQVLDEKKEEYNKYLEQKMRELEESIDKEINEMEKEKEANMQEEKEDVPKKGIVKRLWEKAKSFFKRKIIPALIETIEEELEGINTFKEGIKKDAPSEIQQAKNSRNFINNKTDPKQDIKDVLTILDN